MLCWSVTRLILILLEMVDVLLVSDKDEVPWIGKTIEFAEVCWSCRVLKLCSLSKLLMFIEVC